MNNDINNTQKLRRLGSMSAGEFFGGGNVPIQDLNRAKLEDIPEDVVELANKMIQQDASPVSHPIGQVYQQNRPQHINQNVDIANINVDGVIDIDLFQLAVGKDVVGSIDGVIKHYEQSIEQLRTYRLKLCKLLNIKESTDG